MESYTWGAQRLELAAVEVYPVANNETGVVVTRRRALNTEKTVEATAFVVTIEHAMQNFELCG